LEQTEAIIIKFSKALLLCKEGLGVVEKEFV
jgi:hypothetical protein